MPTINAATTDTQLVSRGNNPNPWNEARHNAGAYQNYAYARTGVSQWFVYIWKKTSDYYIYRSIFAFDVSGITTAPSSAVLKLYGPGASALVDCILVKLDDSATLDLSTAGVAGDFDKIQGFVAGATMAGNVTNYSNVVSPGVNTGAYTDYTLTAACLSDMGDPSRNVLKVALVEYNHDYINVDGLVAGTKKGAYSSYSATANPPYIDYVAGAAGYTHNVAGTAGSDIASVIGTAKASINKCSGI
jgi:hypothetical protein